MGNRKLAKNDYNPNDIIVDGELIGYNRDKKRHLYSVPEGVTSIKERLFAGDTFVRRVELPEGLETIGAGAFDGCHSLKYINLPQSLKKIGGKAFRNCGLEGIEIPGGVKKIEQATFCGNRKLKNVKFNEGLEEISDNSFENTSLESISIPKSVRGINSYAFSSSELKEVEIPDKLKYIEGNAFAYCPNLTVKINERSFNANSFMQRELGRLLPSLRYAEKHDKFYPNVPEIMFATPDDCFENFYKYSKDWKEVLELWEQNSKEKISTQELVSFYKVCFVLGLFQSDKIKNKEWSGVAKKFIKENICKIPPEEVELAFENFYTRDCGFNPEYALFFMQNYEVGKSDFGKNLYFLQYEPYEGDLISYNAEVYNEWKTIKSYYPNKTIVRNREKGSKNNNLTISNVLGVVCGVPYKEVPEGYEELAIRSSCYGYDDQEFKKLCKIWNQSLELSKKQKILRICDDTTLDGPITYEYLKNDNIEILFSGEKSNCCSRVNHTTGIDPYGYGLTKSNAGVVEFYRNNEFIGHSLVWYNGESNIVCLDNIEIPETRKTEVNSVYRKSFANTLARLAKNIVLEMKRNGYRVDAVTVGCGRNDARDILNGCARVSSKESPLPKDYVGYTDAGMQYVIYSNFMEKSPLEQDEEKE